MSGSSVVQDGIAALLVNSKQNLTYVVAGFVVILLSTVQYGRSKREVDVPAIGPSGRLTSYYGAMRFMLTARAMLEEGYTKFQLRTFKVPMFGKWLVVVSDPELIEEVRKAPDDILSIQAANNEAVSAKYTLGQRVYANSYHVNLIASHLTKNIATMYNNMRDEIAQAFVDNFPQEGTEWTTFSITEPIMQIVCRSTNRTFVGLPLCRNKDYLDLNIRFTVDVVKAAYILSLFPESLKGIASQFLTSVPSVTNRGLKHLSPVIEERMKQVKEHTGDWPEKPNDLLSWLMDEAHDHSEEGDTVALTQRLLALNFAAIHTTSMTFIHALLHLVTCPEYIRPLREEVENIIYSEGWSKASLQSMRKLDSFLKETLRLNSLLMLPMSRKVLVDYTLSDGTFLSAGTTVSCNLVTAHFHNARYSDPYTFDGNRFLEETESAKHQMSGVSTDFLSFGYGRHACPGRLFAANELKTMMAYLLIHYDVKLEDGVTARPKDFEFGSAVVPNLKARVMFRKRQV